MADLSDSELEVEALVRIRLFEALSEADSRYSALVERLHEVVFRYDGEWRITFLNHAWETLLGYSTKASLNKNFLDFVYEEDKKSMLDYIDESNEVYKEMRLCHHDGHSVWFELSIKSNAEGEGGVGLLHSIDHHKNVESTLRKARDLAIEAAEVKTNFVANMSHEIRTPLNGVSGGLQLLMTTNPSEEQQKYIDIGLKSSTLLQKITNDILDYSKAEAENLVLEKSDITLISLVENALLIATPITNTVEVVCTINDNVPKKILGDPTRINQILINLLSNAFKFTQEGCINVDVNVEALMSNTAVQQIVFSVRDTGIGIPAAQQKMIFEPFAQIDASITRKYGGTGLGLAIVKRFVNLMSGQIFVESEEGVGTQFTIKIPLQTACPG